MIRAIDFKPLDLSDDEFEYYNLIINEYTDRIFQDTFDVDENDTSEDFGCITFVKPPMNKQLPMIVIFFLFNVMLNQRRRKMDDLHKIMKIMVEKINGKE